MLMAVSWRAREHTSTNDQHTLAAMATGSSPLSLFPSTPYSRFLLCLNICAHNLNVETLRVHARVCMQH